MHAVANTKSACNQADFFVVYYGKLYEYRCCIAGAVCSLSCTEGIMIIPILDKYSYPFNQMFEGCGSRQYIFDVCFYSLIIK